MAFLTISKNFSNILVEQLFLHFQILLLTTVAESPMRLDLYLKDDKLSTEILSGFPAFVTGDSSLLNCHKLPEVLLYTIKF